MAKGLRTVKLGELLLKCYRVLYKEVREVEKAFGNYFKN